MKLAVVAVHIQEISVPKLHPIIIVSTTNKKIVLRSIVPFIVPVPSTVTIINKAG
jgi:hypothetical protein